MNAQNINYINCDENFVKLYLENFNNENEFFDFDKIDIHLEKNFEYKKRENIEFLIFSGQNIGEGSIYFITVPNLMDTSYNIVYLSETHLMSHNYLKKRSKTQTVDFYEFDYNFFHDIELFENYISSPIPFQYLVESIDYTKKDTIIYLSGTKEIYNNGKIAELYNYTHDNYVIHQIYNRHEKVIENTLLQCTNESTIIKYNLSNNSKTSYINYSGIEYEFIDSIYTSKKFGKKRTIHNIYKNGELWETYDQLISKKKYLSTTKRYNQPVIGYDMFDDHNDDYVYLIKQRSQSKSKSYADIYSSHNSSYFFVERANHIGLIDSNFTTVIPMKYDYLYPGVTQNQFVGSTVTEDMFFHSEVLNNLGDTIFTKDKRIVPISNYYAVPTQKKVWYDGLLQLCDTNGNNLPYLISSNFINANYGKQDKTNLIYVDNNKYGLINVNGQVIIPAEHLNLWLFETGVIARLTSSKYKTNEFCLIDSTNTRRSVIFNQYQFTNSNTLIVKVGKSFGAYRNYKLVVPIKYDEIIQIGNTLIVQENGLYYFFNEKTDSRENECIEITKLNGVHPIIIYQKGDQFGLITKDFCTKPDFEVIMVLNKESQIPKYCFSKNGRNGFIDYDGNSHYY